MSFAKPIGRDSADSLRVPNNTIIGSEQNVGSPQPPSSTLNPQTGAAPGSDLTYNTISLTNLNNLTFSSTPTQSEVEALRDEVAALIGEVNTRLSSVKTQANALRANTTNYIISI